MDGVDVAKVDAHVVALVRAALLVEEAQGVAWSRGGRGEGEGEGEGERGTELVGDDAGEGAGGALDGDLLDAAQLAHEGGAADAGAELQPTRSFPVLLASPRPLTHRDQVNETRLRAYSESDAGTVLVELEGVEDDAAGGGREGVVEGVGDGERGPEEVRQPGDLPLRPPLAPQQLRVQVRHLLLAQQNVT